MNLKLVDKKNVGIVSTLILVILLSQSRFFDFLIDTILGRTILILLILAISHTSKILGVVSVLFIIIMFNQSNLGYMEGFTNNDIQNSLNTEEIKEKVETKKGDLKIKRQNGEESPTTSSSNSTSESFEAREGFNIIDRETTILKGKNSNELPVFHNEKNQSEYVQPYDSKFSSEMQL